MQLYRERIYHHYQSMQIENRRLLSLFRSELRRLESVSVDSNEKDAQLSTCFETNGRASAGDKNIRSEDRNDLHELLEGPSPQFESHHKK
jgi:hypothetical protein